MKQPYITVRLTKKEIETLRHIAKKDGITVNMIAAQLLRDYLKDFELKVTVSEKGMFI